MPPEEGEGTSSVPVSMDDLKEFKDSLTSSVAAEMQQMREMIAQLLQAQKDGTPLLLKGIPSLPMQLMLLRPRPKKQQKALGMAWEMKKLVTPLNPMKTRNIKKPLLGFHPILLFLTLI